MARRSSGSRAQESGTVLVDVIGIAIISIFLTTMVLYAVGWAYAFTLSSHAAREGARQASVGRDATSAAIQALPTGWRDRAEVHTTPGNIRVELDVPSFFGLSLTASTTVGYVVEPGVDGRQP